MIGEVEKDPWGLTLKIVTKRLVSRKKTPGLDNADRVKYIVGILFPRVEPFQRQDRSSCVVRSEELFTLEELKRADRRLKANTAPGIDGLPNEILEEAIGLYPEILLEVFNSCLREGKFFADWKKQRLVLLRMGNKPLGDASSYRFCALISIDIRNAFNTARWNICIEAMVAGGSTCLERHVRRFPAHGPTSWTSIIGFADDALVMCAADDVKILELRINDNVWWAKR